MMQPAMAPVPPRPSARSRPFAWLLAFALWLPVAQWTAVTHALQHLRPAAGSSLAGEGRHQPQELPGFCAVCIDAATVAGAAPLPTLPAWPPALPPHAQPRFTATAADSVRSVPPYLSRAPPLLHS